MLKQRVIEEIGHDGVLVLLWAAHSELEVFPNSHRIEHGDDGTRSSWGFIPSRRRVDNIDPLKIEFVQGGLQVANHHLVVDSTNQVQVYIRFQFRLSHCSRGGSRFRICWIDDRKSMGDGARTKVDGAANDADDTSWIPLSYPFLELISYPSACHVHVCRYDIDIVIEICVGTGCC